MSLATLMTWQSLHWHPRGRWLLISQAPFSYDQPHLWKGPSRAAERVQRIQRHKNLCFFSELGPNKYQSRQNLAMQQSAGPWLGKTLYYNERTARIPFWFEKCYITKNVLFLLYISHPHIIYISYCTCLKGTTFLPIITIFKLPLSQFNQWLLESAHDYINT